MYFTRNQAEETYNCSAWSGNKIFNKISKMITTKKHISKSTKTKPSETWWSNRFKYFFFYHTHTINIIILFRLFFIFIHERIFALCKDIGLCNVLKLDLEKLCLWWCLLNIFFLHESVVVDIQYSVEATMPFADEPLHFF